LRAEAVGLQHGVQAAQFARHLGPGAVVGHARRLAGRRHGRRHRIHVGIGPGGRQQQAFGRQLAGVDALPALLQHGYQGGRRALGLDRGHQREHAPRHQRPVAVDRRCGVQGKCGSQRCREHEMFDHRVTKPC